MNNTDQNPIPAKFSPPFDIQRPRILTAPFVFNSPHSGRVYPESFLESSRLDARSLRKSEDAFVEELFADVVSLGAPLLHAHFPRAYLDVNREPYELDPELIADTLPSYANTASIRVIGGLGTIARIVTESEEIYREPVPLEDALNRISTLYKPYHAALCDLLTDSWNKFGHAILVDCHSMPSLPASHHDDRPDFVLGDRFGSSCDVRIVQFVEQQLKALGYVVMRNKPYSGGYITEHYGQPEEGLHALQIEVKRALYLNESTFTKTKNFAFVKRDLKRLSNAMFRYIPELLEDRPAAAE